MAGRRNPNPIDLMRGHPPVDRGTTNRERSHPPVVIGRDVEEKWYWRTEKFFLNHSAMMVARTLIWVLRRGDETPIEVSLFEHYIDGTGSQYDLKVIPETWQDWIVKTTKGKPGKYKDLNPYGAGIYDLQHGLGHFDCDVVVAGHQKTYLISDYYQFGFKEHDRRELGRHGFVIPDSVSKESVDRLKSLLPSVSYHNPGGFDERWEIKKAGRDTVLFIPQQFLVENGTPFPVRGKFTR